MQLAQGKKAKTGERAAPDRSNRKVALILAAARKLFLDHGFDAISMDMVARQATVSKATLYAHFTSKEELFTATMVDEANRISDEIWQITPDDDDVASVLRHVAQNFVDIFLTERALLLQRAVVGVVPSLPSIGAAIFESGPKALADRLAQFLATTHERGQLNVPNPTLAATQFLSIVSGDFPIRGLLIPSNPPRRTDVDVQIEVGINMFLNFYSSARPPAT